MSSLKFDVCEETAYGGLSDLDFRWTQAFILQKIVELLPSI